MTFLLLVAFQLGKAGSLPPPPLATPMNPTSLCQQCQQSNNFWLHSIRIESFIQNFVLCMLLAQSKSVKSL